MFDVELVRQDFPILSRKVNGKPIAYLDNASTTQKPTAVLEAVMEVYRKSNSNVHRAGNALADEATELYEKARKKVAKFIGASPEEIVFTRNATESLNFAARFCIASGASKVVLTDMEHHSNIVGWQLASKGRAKLEFLKVAKKGKIGREDLSCLDESSAFSFVHASNVLGCVNDAKSLCRFAHERGARVCIDGAQSAPHIRLNVHSLGCDFFAFSSHKMLGPAGVGVLYVKKEIAGGLEPFFGGGGAVESVSFEGAKFAPFPRGFEPGTPDVAGAVGLACAIGYIEKIGLGRIGRHVSSLHKACAEMLESLKGVKIYGNGAETGILSFNVGGVHPHDIAQFASDSAVMIRAGHHCCQPLMAALGVQATARASFYLYNTKEEAERLAEAVARAREVLS